MTENTPDISTIKRSILLPPDAPKRPCRAISPNALSDDILFSAASKLAILKDSPLRASPDVVYLSDTSSEVEPTTIQSAESEEEEEKEEVIESIHDVMVLSTHIQGRNRLFCEIDTSTEEGRQILHILTYKQERVTNVFETNHPTIDFIKIIN